MFFGKNIKAIAAISAVLIMASAALTSCSSTNKSASQISKTEAQTIGDQYPEQYGNYIESFSSEVEPFVKEELPEILSSISALNSSNYAEWKGKYTAALEKTLHWYNEVGSAEMFCPSDKKEAHQSLVTTVATIYKIFEGLQPRTEAADNGDFSQLTSKGTEYAKAVNIANDMWTRAINDLK